jgi:hypothetical protein
MNAITGHPADKGLQVSWRESRTCIGARSAFLVDCRPHWFPRTALAQAPKSPSPRRGAIFARSQVILRLRFALHCILCLSLCLTSQTVTPGAGSFTRISDAPLTEWHGFATIPEPGKTGYSLVVSKAGDWTTKTIGAPPKEVRPSPQNFIFYRPVLGT